MPRKAAPLRDAGFVERNSGGVTLSVARERRQFTASFSIRGDSAHASLDKQRDRSIHHVDRIEDVYRRRALENVQVQLTALEREPRRTLASQHLEAALQHRFQNRRIDFSRED